ncbi:hypothetical protein TVAG_260240 [Trichomonas vaginalis G3]|uniref:DUF3447 domain-containing protein n=1 Tax=Trichomonas vaginalis (strain ATCC PRA-98 / G3) TaxID=412133 RepID=A2E8V6_TRIV3|nr:protein ubiquitination [Trichomonas vaginalis G3]EAY10938.1 hypothetical protein TVAG_260240 [Trichomonas vaginalis G3]KAI5485523.1 protein ubiquitination [Trichomonas vaginalis G3]|eukprot:XP_001323161.1 hypothetical protein [Trichomonas vaginalis G3]
MHVAILVLSIFFIFFISNLKAEITQESLHLACVGGNTDIINECLKERQIDEKCIQFIAESHNNKLLEYIIDRNLFDFSSPFTEIEFDQIIDSRNLKFVFLISEINQNSIIPWGAGFPETLEYLTECKFEFNTKNKYGKNALLYALENKCMETVKYLISNGVDVNIKDRKRKSALCYAAKSDCKEAVELLISHGAEIKSKSGYLRFTTGAIDKNAFHYAVKNKNGEIIELLNSHGADFIPFIKEAIASEDKEGIEFFISRGFDINTKDIDGRTPLHLATVFHQREMEEFLISHGADINIEDNHGYTPNDLKC